VFDEVAEGVFVRRYRVLDQNIGIIVGDEGVLVIDTRSTHAHADQVLDDISTITEKPVRWVVDTHWHWDHSFGNSRFTDALIWGHARCRAALIERGDSMRADGVAWLPKLKDDFDQVVITPPDQVFETDTSIDLGSHQVDLSYRGLGHTDADILVSVRDRDVLFAGDLLENGAPPSFSDSYPLAWPSTLVQGLDGVGGVIVPGHGDAMTPDDARSQITELEAVADLARGCIAGETSVDEAVRRGPYPTDYMREAIERAIAVGDS
jgi:glyoxylase-like metal-dependent hydrolase (beta-lactamase superfamily II)